MLQWTIEGARKSKLLSEVIVATDDDRIRLVAEAVGVKVIMTDSSLNTGSDRVNAAIENIDCDVVVNIQGDEPLVSGDLVDSLVSVFLEDSNLDMATMAHPITEEELLSLNSVKVVLNCKDEALYFSRFPMPYSRLQSSSATSLDACMKHIGMYAYTKVFLNKFCKSPPALIESAESLEQLRALYLGAKIKVIRVKEAMRGVDAPEDVGLIEKLLSQQGRA